MLVAPFVVLYAMMLAGVLVFLVIYTIRQAHRRGRAPMLRTIAIWVGAFVLGGVAISAWTVTSWRSPVSATSEQLIGRWISESPDGSATITLRADGWALIEDVPSEAVRSTGEMDDDADLPALLSGAGKWKPSFDQIELACADGSTRRVNWQVVESASGSIYLHVFAGDLDGPSYLAEFTRADPRASTEEPASTPAC